MPIATKRPKTAVALMRVDLDVHEELKAMRTHSSEALNTVLRRVLDLPYLNIKRGRKKQKK